MRCRALQHFLVEVRPRQQQLGSAADHRQRGAQFVADVGIELAVALDHFGQAVGIIIQRLGQLADFVVCEVRRQRLRLAGAAAIGAQPRRQVGHRPHHFRGGPPAQHQRQQAEDQHRGQQGAVELHLAALRLGHVVGEEEPGLVGLAHRQAVGEWATLFVQAADDAVDAGLEVDPVRVFFVDAVELVAGVHPAADLVDRHRRVVARIGVEPAHVLVDVAFHHVFDELVFHARARPLGGEREQAGQAEAQQHERKDDSTPQPPAVPAALVGGPGGGASRLRHRARRSGSRYRGGSGSAARRTACRPRRAGHGCARAASPNRAVLRPRRGFRALAG